MEMEKKTPSTFERKGNDSSQPLGGSAALGVGFDAVKIQQSQTEQGNKNTTSGVSGGQE